MEVGIEESCALLK